MFYSNYDEMSIGPVPLDEECIPFSPNGYDVEGARAECHRFKKYLELIFDFGENLDGRFKIASNPYDGGDYYDVAYRYNTNDPKASLFALLVEGNTPSKWKISQADKYAIQCLWQTMLKNALYVKDEEYYLYPQPRLVWRDEDILEVKEYFDESEYSAAFKAEEIPEFVAPDNPLSLLTVSDTGTEINVLSNRKFA